MHYLKKALATDIDFIYNLARDIWQQTYVETIGQEQVDYMLDLFYSPIALNASLENGHQLYLIIIEGQRSGYLDIENRGHDYFIHKIYLKNQGQRKGLGSKVLEEIIQELIPPGSDLRLHVNRQNYKAINFYFKNGFTIEALGDFDIGNGYFMNDFVMKLS